MLVLCELAVGGQGKEMVRTIAVGCLGSHLRWVLRWISFKMELPNIGFWIRLVLLFFRAGFKLLLSKKQNKTKLFYFL